MIRWPRNTNKATAYKFSMRTTMLACVFLFGLTACGQPFLIIPGDRLAGEAVSGPIYMKDLPSTIQVELRPEEPYSINLRVVEVERGFFIGTANQRSQWAKQIESDPFTRISIGGKIFTVNASRVTEADKRSRVLRAYEDKYGLDPRRESINNMLLFELRPK
jgi:hypothetical protein